MTMRITTRRARACTKGACSLPGDVEIAQTDQGELQSYFAIATQNSVTSAMVVCTLVDLGDPRFRMWLRGTLAPRIATADGLTLEVILGPGSDIAPLVD